MKLHELPKDKSKKGRKRVGRGHGSGYVKTAGRGMKGQKARSGGGIPAHFQGGGLSMFRRLPKLPGFRSINRIEYSPVNLDTINERFTDGEEVTPETLKEKGVVKDAGARVKILARGNLEKKLTIKAHAWSEAAEKKTREAGSELVKLD